MPELEIWNEFWSGVYLLVEERPNVPLHSGSSAKLGLLDRHVQRGGVLRALALLLLPVPRAPLRRHTHFRHTDIKHISHQTARPGLCNSVTSQLLWWPSLSHPYSYWSNMAFQFYLFQWCIAFLCIISASWVIRSWNHKKLLDCLRPPPQSRYFLFHIRSCFKIPVCHTAKAHANNAI